MTPGHTVARLDRLLLLLLAVSLCINVGVVWWFVKGRVATPDARRRPDVAVGMILKPIAGVLASGQATTISYSEDQRPLVLYVVSGTCKWCERNLNSISALSQFAGARYRFVGISLSSDASDAKGQEPPFRFPVVLTTGPVPFQSTPQTIVVASNGRVMRSWTGAYIGATKLEIERYFGARLPDIRLGSHGG